MFQDKFQQKIKFPFYGVRLPEIQIDTKKSHFDYLRDIARTNFKKMVADGRIPESKVQIYADRAKEELDVFNKLGVVDYVLLVYSEVTNWCAEQGITMGSGRGSCPGSLLFYLLGITAPDPIEHDLLFERFISADRAKINTVNGINYLEGSSLPDVDSDISYTEAHLVYEHLQSKYQGKTSKISTCLKLTGKIAIKEASKIVLNYSEEQSMRLSNMVERTFGKVEKLSDVVKNSKDFQEWLAESPLHEKTFNIALKLEDVIHTFGIHPSGLAISYQDIDSTVPLQCSKEGETVSCYDMEDVANFVVKLDILALRTASLVRKVCDLVNIKPEDIDVGDDSIYEYLRLRNDYSGLFQIKGGLGEKTIKDVRPENLEQLSHCIALGRPGAYIYIPDYVTFKNSKENLDVDPRIAHILNPTGGILVFQEQLMFLCRIMADFTGAESNSIRKIVGKKLSGEMVKHKDRFIENSLKNGYDKDFIDKTWASFEASANYSFNKSHSTAYAFLTAQTTYLKANYAIQFFCVLLSLSKHEIDPMKVIRDAIREMPHFGIKLLLPDLKKSEIDFSIDGTDIRFGLSSIKGIAEKTLEKLIGFAKAENSTKLDVFSCAKEHKLSIGALGNLIMAGCFDYLCNGDRAKFLLEAQLWIQLTDRERVLLNRFIESHKDIFNILRYWQSGATDENNKAYVKESRLGTIRRDFAPFKQIYEFNKKNSDLIKYKYEKSVLGFSTCSLREIYDKHIPNLSNLEEVLAGNEKDTFRFVIECSNIHKKISKNNNNYLYLEGSDETGAITIRYFNKELDWNLIDVPTDDGSIYFVSGNRSGDTVFAKELVPQNQFIITQRRELKKNT